MMLMMTSNAHYNDFESFELWGKGRISLHNRKYTFLVFFYSKSLNTLVLESIGDSNLQIDINDFFDDF